MSLSDDTEKLAVMVNGVPGRMASAVAHEVVERGLVLASEALTGSDVEQDYVQLHDDVAPVRLIGPEEHAACLTRMREQHKRLVLVDYTHPNAVNGNVAAYAEAGMSFVVGTTGGDESAMTAAVTNAAKPVYAVIAPNMGKQIVAFQAMMELMATQFPGAFSGYTLSVKESHQSTKVDTSGTAKAVIGSFNKLGIPFELDEVDKVRDTHRSMSEMNVPGKFVTTGHAFHTYKLTSPDGSVNFEFQHNVCGRGFYAAGTVDAVLFLDRQRRDASEKRVFDMIDILRAGSML